MVRGIVFVSLALFCLSFGCAAPLSPAGGGAGNELGSGDGADSDDQDLNGVGGVRPDPDEPCVSLDSLTVQTLQGVAGELEADTEFVADVPLSIQLDWTDECGEESPQYTSYALIGPLEGQPEVRFTILTSYQPHEGMPRPAVYIADSGYAAAIGEWALLVSDWAEAGVAGVQAPRFILQASTDEDVPATVFRGGLTETPRDPVFVERIAEETGAAPLTTMLNFPDTFVEVFANAEDGLRGDYTSDEQEAFVREIEALMDEAGLPK